MARIVFGKLDDAPLADFAGVAGVAAHGAVASRPVIGGAERPLWLWQHALAPGAGLALARPAAGHAYYVQAGSVACAGHQLAEGSAILAEHLCEGEIVAGPGGASLLHFHAREGGGHEAAQGGGHIHAAGPQGRLQMGNIPGTHLADGHAYLGTLWAELDCPTCQLWLYRSDLAGPVPQERTLHYHSVDEIILVLSGEMLLGGRRPGGGTAIAIDAGVRYRMGVGEPGVSFLNFRARHSNLVMLEQGDTAPVDESETWRLGREIV